MQEQHRGCGYYCQRLSMFIPVVFVIGLIGWSYYAFIIAYGQQVEDIATRVFISILFHVVLLLFLWSYVMAISTQPAKPPPHFYLTEEEHSNMRASDRGRDVLHSVSTRVAVQERTTTGAVRYCDICRCIKPDRAHHCAMCMQCVLKMDHHCPWVGNCVGYTNYKYFVLFLFFTCAYTFYITVCCVPYISDVWNKRTNNPLNFHVLIMFLISLVFFLTVFGLFSFHVYLTWHNKTTLESSRAPCFRGGFADPKHYDMGGSYNFKQVFGKVPSLWIIPLSGVLGNGYEWETRAYTQSDLPSNTSLT